MDACKYRDLRVWQRSMDLVTECFRLTDSLPATERYGLAAQIRRAAVSIPANIAEGNFRLHRGDYRHHVSVARGSLGELATHLEIARRLEFMKEDELTSAYELIDHVGRMLTRFAERLAEPKSTSPNPESRMPNP